MKNVKNAIEVVIAVVISFVFSSVGAKAEVMVINHGGASLPRELAPQGESWNSAAVNWMQMLRTGSNILGSSRNLVVRKNDLGDYREMMSRKDIRTWKGQDDSSGPTIEYGNFWHQGVQIKTTAGETFVPAQITVSAESLVGINTVLSATSTTFETLNFFRQVLNSDNTVAQIQDSYASATNFLYGGIGKSVTIVSGSGTVAERVDTTSNNVWNQNFRIRYTVTVPYKNSSNVDQTPKVVSWEVTRTVPVLSMSGNNLFLTNTMPGKIYRIENSSTLMNDWVVFSSHVGGGLIPPIVMTHKVDTTSYPKMFYRVAW